MGKLALSALLVFLATHAVAGENWVVLEQGSHNYAPLNPGTGWLALISKNGQWLLSPTKVTTSKPANPSQLEPEDREAISVNSSHKEAIALLNYPSLKAGPVETSPFSQNTLKKINAFPVGKPPKFLFHDSSYEFSIEGRNVVVFSGSERTVLGSSSLYSPGQDFANIDWAGDLDRDGKLDFLVRGSEKGFCLFLSSLKQGNNVVALVGCQLE